MVSEWFRSMNNRKLRELESGVILYRKSSCQQILVHWQPPQPGFIKINFDSSFSQDHADTGHIIHNSLEGFFWLVLIYFKLVLFILQRLWQFGLD